MGGKVVILVPAYQCQQTVAETLESLQSQGQALARVDAVIVADDGLRNRTQELARQAWRSTVPLSDLCSAAWSWRAIRRIPESRNP
jgi:hypothetical protein